MRNSNSSYLLAGTFLLTGLLHGQNLSRVVVTVKDDIGQGIERANVRLESDTGPGLERLAGSGGEASFSKIAPGSYTARVSSPGYQPLSRSFEVNLTKGNVDPDFTLIRLAELKESAEVRGTAGPISNRLLPRPPNYTGTK